MARQVSFFSSLFRSHLMSTHSEKWAVNSVQCEWRHKFSFFLPYRKSIFYSPLHTNPLDELNYFLKKFSRVFGVIVVVLFFLRLFIRCLSFSNRIIFHRNNLSVSRAFSISILFASITLIRLFVKILAWHSRHAMLMSSSHTYKVLYIFLYL